MFPRIAQTYQPISCLLAFAVLIAYSASLLALPLPRHLSPTHGESSCLTVSHAPLVLAHFSATVCLSIWCLEHFKPVPI